MNYITKTSLTARYEILNLSHLRVSGRFSVIKKCYHKDSILSTISLMAGSTGFEPAISSVTGRRDNHFTTSPRQNRRSAFALSKLVLNASTL